MSQDETARLERILLDLIQHARDRCGVGFGKYPLGVLHAIQQLQPLVQSERVNERLRDLNERLAR